MKHATYIVAGRHPWNYAHFNETLADLPGDWHFAATPDDLKTLMSTHDEPRYVFFIHWSEKIPVSYTAKYECVCFHMTDVPFGRGGSPLQNLIARGVTETKMTALRMTDDFDAGPVYLKKDFSLAEGSAYELFQKASRLCCLMIAEIVTREPTPVPQSGEATVFRRRKPKDSEITEEIDSLEALHNHIRMLDAPGYPHAYIDVGALRLEFTASGLEGSHLEAKVTVRRNEPESNQ